MATVRTVLILENDPATLRMYQRALEQEYQVLPASDEEDILSLLNAHTVHAIVLEPGPVGGRGWGLLAELQRQSDQQSIPIILCTAQDEKRRGLELGTAAYLVKPVLPAALLEMVRRLTGPESSPGGAV